MAGEEKTREQLSRELAELRQQLAEAERRIAELEASGAEHEQVKKALLESQGELSAVFDSTPVAMALVDGERRVRKANRAAVEFGERPPGEMMGLRSGEALRCLHSLDDPKGCGFGPSCDVCGVRRSVLDTFKTGRNHYLVEVGFLSAAKGGQEERHLLVSTTLVSVAEGRMVLVSLEDVTERKRAEEALQESEERYRSVVENSHAGILIVDGEYRFIYANDELCQIMGRPREEVIDHDFRDFLDDETREMVVDRYVRRRRGEEVPPRYEFNFIRKDGEKRRGEISTSLIKDSAGNIRTVGQLLDTTERARAEEALRRSEERYTLAQRAANIGSWDWDIRTGALHWSDTIEPMFGFGHGEFGATYEAFLESVHPEDRQYVIDSVDACVAEGKDYAIEHRIVWPDGTTRWVSETGDVIRDEDGKAIRMLGIVQDITERKRAEEALKESEEKLRLIFEHAFDGISVHEELPERSRRLLDCNERYAEMAGRSKQELLEIGNTSLVQEDLGPMRSLAENLRLRRERASYEGLFSWKRPDGRENVIEYSAAPIQVGERALTIGIDRDVTERVQVEAIRAQAEEEIAKLARFPNENPYPVLRIAQDGAILYANEASAPLLGFWGCHINECLPDDWQRLIQDALRSESSTEVEFEIQGRIFSLTFTPVVEEGYVNVYGLDITERKEAAEALHRHAAELEARNAELDAFAHTVAHDLKNPLGLAIGYAKLLTKEHPTLLPEDIDRHLHIIVQNGYKMNAIIDELLLLSEVRKSEVPATSLDMASIVSEAQQRLIRAIEEHHAEIVVPERWPQALGYGPWVEEVWANYLDNAIKYGGRPPRIQLGADVEPENRVRFWVRDNGPGLSTEERARLFTPFDQLGRGHARGHGLGLSIVRRIVEKLGGEVDVKSEVGRGSTFAFTLPTSG